LEPAVKLREEIEGKKLAVDKAKDDLINSVSSLNELGEREVKTPEVARILD